MDPATSKRCSGCGEDKVFSAFHKGAARFGLKAACRSCTSVKSATYVGDPCARRKAILKFQLKEYGLTLDDYDTMLGAQGGGCFLCGHVPSVSRLSVDHCHTSGAVRSLLCNHCNVGLGHFRDNPHLLRSAALYLEQHQPAQGFT